MLYGRHPSTGENICLFVCLCLSNRPSVCPSVWLSVCPSVRLSIERLKKASRKPARKIDRKRGVSMEWGASHPSSASSYQVKGKSQQPTGRSPANAASPGAPTNHKGRSYHNHNRGKPDQAPR